jgi:hypothetical protein
VKYKPNKSSKSAEFRINRRIIQEYGLEESKRVGALDSIIEQKHKHKEQKKQIKSEHKRKKHKEKQKSQKTGLHIGINYEQKSQEFIINGGDIESCPFD